MNFDLDNPSLMAALGPKMPVAVHTDFQLFTAPTRERLHHEQANGESKRFVRIRHIAFVLRCYEVHDLF